MKPYAYDRRDDHGSIQLHQGNEIPHVRVDEKLISLYSAEQVVDLVAELVAENAAMKEIIDSVTDLGNEPQFHEQGMGCGLEDRGITDRYEAMRYGWEQAMERVYGEVIPCAEELSFQATDAYLSRLRNEAQAEIAVMMDGHAARYDALAKQTEDFGVDNRYRYTAAMFRGVAKELREGKAVPESGKQSFVIPDGYALVPNEMCLSSEAMEALCFHCGDGGHMFGEFTDGVLFVGEIEPEEGKKVYGLHIATADYPEEGCATICEFLPVLREGKAGEVCSE